MCDPIVTPLVAYTGYTMFKSNQANTQAKADKFEAKQDMKNAEEKAEKKAANLVIKNEADASMAAQTGRKQREEMFKKYGYRGTFGTSGGGLGLTNPASGGKNTLLGGA